MSRMICFYIDGSFTYMAVARALCLEKITVRCKMKVLNCNIIDADPDNAGELSPQFFYDDHPAAIKGISF